MDAPIYTDNRMIKLKARSCFSLRKRQRDSEQICCGLTVVATDFPLRAKFEMTSCMIFLLIFDYKGPVVRPVALCTCYLIMLKEKPDIALSFFNWFIV